MRATNQYGCDTIVKRNVQVNKPPQASISGPDNVCVNQIASYQLSGENVDTILWEVESGQLIKDSSSRSIQVRWQHDEDDDIQANEGVVKAKIFSGSGCEKTIEYPVRLNTIQAKISPKDLQGCVPLDAIFSAHKSTNASSYVWKLDEEQFATGQRANYTFHETGYHRVKLVTTSKEQCRDTAYSEIRLTPKPDANFTVQEPDDLQDYHLSKDKIVTKNKSIKAQKYIWDFGDGFTSNQRNPTYEYSDTGNYEITLYATRTNGCMDSMKKKVEVIAEPYLYVPNAFTPDGDGLNDNFAVEARNVYDFKVRVYNRWGETLFKSTDQDFKWDGTYKGKPVPLESYLYLVTAKGYQGEFLRRSGTLTIVK